MTLLVTVCRFAMGGIFTTELSAEHRTFGCPINKLSDRELLKRHSVSITDPQKKRQPLSF